VELETLIATRSALRPDSADASAAFSPIAHGRSKSGFRWTDDSVGYALDRFHRQNLRTPTLRELKRGVDDLPSYATIRRLYGSAGEMFHRFGYAVRKPGAQTGRPCTLKRDARGWFLPGAAKPGCG
jgi:hypothetical protein